MKALLIAALLGLTTIASQAVSILTVTTLQDNWTFYMFVDGPVGDRYLNGEWIGNGSGGGGGLLPAGDPSGLFNGLQYGENTVSMAGQTSVTFTLLTPIGDRPAVPNSTLLRPVPDTGASIALLAFGLAGVLSLHAISRSRARAV
jgi:hypothetical protein